jgi:hypothetical protein
VFAALSIGYLDTQGIVDGRTQTVWAFGGGVQYRASLEKSIGNSSGIGITGTLARLPLVYDGATCNQCDAHANVWSLGGSFHGGGALGLHQVIDANAGVTRFENFRDDNSGQRLVPKSDTDFSFGIGYGIGYSTSARMEFFLLQEYAGIIHQRDGLDNGARTLSRQLVTRIGLRYGMGYKK